MSYCIAIVGRANVGKSSLFNYICGDRVAIVDPQPGITRDRISREIHVSGGRSFELVDTGGVGMESADELIEDVEMQIDIAIAKADWILFVVDAQNGLHPYDETIAKRLRSAGKKIIVVANKAENPVSNQNVMEFFRLGLGEPLAVSVAHNIGLEKLKDLLKLKLQENQDTERLPGTQAVKLAFVGQRNVGKSTMINYLAQEKRVVVNELPGTTRDSVDVMFDYWDGELSHSFIAIDTAGVRKKKQLTNSVDYYSQVRTHKAVQRADVVIQMIDAQRKIAKVDKKWGGLILDNYKPTVIAINKIDLVPENDEDIEQQFIDYIWRELPGMRFAPIIFISARTGENVFPMLELAHKLYQESQTRVKTSELNEVMEEITARRPPPSSTNKRGKILFATQVATGPPSIALFVNDAANITDSYQRYLVNEFREVFPFSNVPIKIMTRRRKSAKNQ